MAKRFPQAAPDDFDFIIGDCSVHYRRLNERLCDCKDWMIFNGRMSTQKILQDFGNVEDNVLGFPQGGVRAAAIRSFNADLEAGRSGDSMAALRTRSTFPLSVVFPVESALSTLTTILTEKRSRLDSYGKRILAQIHCGNKLSQLMLKKPGGKNWHMEFERREV